MASGEAKKKCGEVKVNEKKMKQWIIVLMERDEADDVAGNNLLKTTRFSSFS